MALIISNVLRKRVEPHPIQMNDPPRRSWKTWRTWRTLREPRECAKHREPVVDAKVQKRPPRRGTGWGWKEKRRRVRLPVGRRRLLCLLSFQAGQVVPAEGTRRVTTAVEQVQGGPLGLHRATHRATGEAILSFLSIWSHWTLKSTETADGHVL